MDKIEKIDKLLMELLETFELKEKIGDIKKFYETKN